MYLEMKCTDAGDKNGVSGGPWGCCMKFKTGYNCIKAIILQNFRNLFVISHVTLPNNENVSY